MRESPRPGPRVAAVVLAAGASSRMDSGHKLLAELHGRAVVQRVVASARASRADPIVVVLGHRGTEVRACLARDVGGIDLVENPSPDAGLASSLVAGLQALPASVEGCVVMLGDMPFVTAVDVDTLIASFDAGAPSVPVVDGRRGNPVLWPRAFFPDLLGLEGDRGARSLVESHDIRVVEVHLENKGLLLDIDTQADLERARSSTQRQLPSTEPPAGAGS
ncbi:MAG: nucleotidyltransferase family protein [Gemmatimonadetes bacterium]|nr:nucleotidyltransferase family protein [Gemmatimonadota bacterium]